MDNFSRFSTFWKTLTPTPNPQPIFDNLLQAYAEPQRAYHTLEHIHDCLNQFDQVSILAEHPVEVEAALWLHDVVYDPRASDNEERSVDWADDALTNGGVPTEKIDRIRELILATKHPTIPQDQDAVLLVDIDLSILGRDVATFERYEQKIRQEYSHVPEPAFREGRAKILASFLSRPFIYQTSFFRERYETQARKNLSRSVAKNG